MDGSICGGGGYWQLIPSASTEINMDVENPWKRTANSFTSREGIVQDNGVWMPIFGRS